MRTIADIGAAVIGTGFMGVAHTEALRDLLQDDEEDPSVRAAAAISVGQLCDHASVDALTGYARVLASLTMTEPELQVPKRDNSRKAVLAPWLMPTSSS